MGSINASGHTVTLADGPHQVRFTVNRLIAVEEYFGSFAALAPASETRPVATLRTLLCIGIGGATEESVGDLMDGGMPMGPLSEVVGEALADAVGSTTGEAAPVVGPTPGSTS